MAYLPMISGGGSYTPLGQPELVYTKAKVNSDTYTITQNGTYMAVVCARPTVTISNSTGSYIFYYAHSGGGNRGFGVHIATLSVGDTITFSGSNDQVYGVYKLSPMHIGSSYTQVGVAINGATCYAQKACDPTKKYFFCGGAVKGTAYVSGYNVNPTTTDTNYMTSAEYLEDYDGTYAKFATSSSDWCTSAVMILEFS